MNDLAIQQGDDGGLRELALFAGAGGGILGGHLLGWRTVVAVERDAYAAQVLAQRQNDRIIRPFPIWSDVTNFDGRPWRGRVDVVSGGFPCQDISVAGIGAGIDGERSGLWGHMARIIGQVRPRLVYVENSPMLTSRGLGRVLGDLAEMGFHAEWGIVSAADTGAYHLRERIWIVAYADGKPGKERGADHAEQGTGGRHVDRSNFSPNVSNADGWQQEVRGHDAGMGRVEKLGENGKPRFGAWPLESGMGGMADGVANRMDRIKALGNGQVPRVAAAAFNLLSS